MDDQVNRTAPWELTDALDASVRDLASGAVSDAGEVQVEARRILADFERRHPRSPAAGGRKTPKRSRTT